MKIDMTPAAVTLRLQQVAKLRRACLSLAKSGKGLEIQKKHKEDNETVERTSLAIGR